jgi:hemoglobin
MPRTHRRLLAPLAFAVLAIAGCATPPPRTTLFDDLGGAPGVESIVSTMLLKVAEDARVASFFAESNLPRLRKLLAEQFCQVADGPCEYTGYSMRESHRGMVVTEAEFNAVVEALIYAMEDLQIATPTQNRLLARLAPLQEEIVYQ